MTPRQFQLLRFLHNRINSTGICPSFEECMNALSLKSKSGIHRIMRNLKADGYIKVRHNRARNVTITKAGNDAIAPASDSVKIQTCVSDIASACADKTMTEAQKLNSIKAILRRAA